MQILILGCGSSLGVPVLGCKCEVCTSQKPLNARARSSILVQDKSGRFLIDFGADIRMQLLRNNIHHIDAALLTHMHADHVAGIDDLRVFPFFSGAELPLYTTPETARSVRNNYGYLFAKDKMQIEEINYGEAQRILSSEYYFFEQIHGDITSIGIKMGDCVYANDVSSFSVEGIEALKASSNWIIDCISYKAARAHIGLEEVMVLYEMYKPKNVYLTNLSHDLDYYELCRKLPQNIRPLYDGMVLNF